MAPRLLILVGLVVLVGSGCRNQGAVKLTVIPSNFKPSCLRVLVEDDKAHSSTMDFVDELAGKDPTHPLTVAVFREADWGNTLTLTALSLEKPLGSGGACSGTQAERVSTQVTVHQGESAKTAELTLTAVDQDQDGYAAQGTDCDDTDPNVHPGQAEACNGKDDNCNAQADEGLITTWYHDGDGDHYGSPMDPPATGCTPPPGYVDNNQDCNDKNPQIHPGAPELCNGVDDNCDGQVDEGIGKGQACTGSSPCPGMGVCETDGGVRCEAPTPQYVYADNDHDNHGAADAGLTLCGTSPPANYVSSSDDCDDTRANVYPGAPEVCDGLDNNCNGTKDEGFNLGTSCNPGQNCPGTYQCVPDGGSQCTYTTQPSMWYPDDDLDMSGRADAGVLTCTPDAGYVLDAGDCDDGNPFTYPGAPELCDLDDNNCNGVADENAACANPDGGTDGGQWASMNGTTSETFRSVALWGDGGVWVAGANNVLRVLQPGGTTFTNLDGQCVGDWYSIFADSFVGAGLLVGANNLTGYHFPWETTCHPTTSVTDTNAKGVFALWLPAENRYEEYVVGTSISASKDGHEFWSLADGGIKSGPTVPGPLFDVHGLSRDVLFAVGGYDSSATMGMEKGVRVYRFKPDGGTDGLGDWPSEGVQNLPGAVDDPLRGIWVVNPKLAYAVGDSSAFLMWNGTGWSVLSGPAPAEDMLSVVAFGKNSVYVSTASGKVMRYSDGSWSTLLTNMPGTPLNDIAGTSPGNLWVVGNNGKLLHWPH